LCTAALAVTAAAAAVSASDSCALWRGTALMSASARVRACTTPRMKNFMAYEDSTVFPGTALNLVVGPNGAGKSTIVGAMVLGLGFPLKVRPCPARMRASRGRCPALRQPAQRLSASRACSGGDWRALCADDEPMPAVLLWPDYGSRAECRGLDPQRGGGGRARGGLEQAQRRKRAGDHKAPHDAINGHSYTRQSKPPSLFCMRTSLPSDLRLCVFAACPAPPPRARHNSG
jgi:hypothetical protein